MKKKKTIIATVEWRVANQGAFLSVPVKQETFHSWCRPQKLQAHFSDKHFNERRWSNHKQLVGGGDLAKTDW